MIVFIDIGVNSVEISECPFREKQGFVFSVSEFDNEKGDETFRDMIYRFSDGKIESILCRILLGGGDLPEETTADIATLDRIKGLIPRYPFYMPIVCRIVKCCLEQFKGTPVELFNDTAVFSRLPEEEKGYPVSAGNSDLPGLRRSGFHGVYHKYNCTQVSDGKRTVSVVLDEQTTVCAMECGRPLLISLGNTPLEGIMGRTSCGDIDPGIVFYVMESLGISMFEMDHMLKKESGFLGLTGFDESIPDLYGYIGESKVIRNAFSVYKSHILKYLGAGIAVLGGIDSIVFAGKHLRPLLPFVYGILKDLSFLGVHVLCIPWATDEDVVSISTDSSIVSSFLNFTNVSTMIYKEYTSETV